MILTALARYHDRKAQKGELPAFGYSRENISYALILNRRGGVVDLQDLRDTSGKTPRPGRMTVPQSFQRSGTKPPPFFLWDKTSFVLGVASDPSKKGSYRVADRDHGAFCEFHRGALADSEDEGLLALLAFLHHWEPGQFDYSPFNAQSEVLDTNIVFRLDGDRQYLHERKTARAIWSKQVYGWAWEAVEESEGTLCLATGETGLLARKHIPIKGFQDAPFGAFLVTFNKSAFTSYGKEQGANAPVSVEATFAYTTALNHLLRSDPVNNQRIQIGDTTTVFWAEGESSSEAEAAEDLYLALLSPPDDAQEAEKIKTVLEQVAKGRPMAEVDPQLHEGTRFYVLGLAPNGPRLAVRFWYADTLGPLVRNLSLHYQDFSLEPAPWNTPPAVWRFLYETAAQRDAKNISPNLSGELMRAVITGRPYPRSLLSAIIMRMRADGDINGLRAAICKACLNRDHRLGTGNIHKEVPMSLDYNDTSPGYRLGRLFAVLEKIQNDALGDVNAGIADRFYAAASATPASIFGMLLNKAKSHLSAVRRKKGEGLAHHLERHIGEIMEGLSPELPRSLPLEQQGRFAVGYYHQKEALRPQKASATENEAAESNS